MGWRPPAQSAVRALAVIVLSPLFDDELGLLECVEDFAVEQVIAEARIEALAIPILSGRARCDVGGLGSRSADPVPNLLCNELWPVVGTDECWRPPQDAEIRQRIHHINGVQFPADPDRQRLPSELIDDVQCAIDPPIVSPVLDKVIGPNMIGMLWPEPDTGPVIQPQPPFVRLLLRYFKPLTSPDPLNPLFTCQPAWFSKAVTRR